MITFNHAYAFCFSVKGSLCEDGSDVTPKDIREAMMSRLAELTDGELMEAVDCPFDSIEDNHVSVW